MDNGAYLLSQARAWGVLICHSSELYGCALAGHRAVSRYGASLSSCGAFQCCHLHVSCECCADAHMGLMPSSDE